MTVRLKTTIAVAAAALALAVVIGCGGDGSSSGGDASATSREQFVEKASAACAREREDVLNRVAVYKKQHSSEAVPEAVATERAVDAALIATIEDEADAIRRLPAPEGGEEEVAAILTAIEKDLAEAKKMAKKSEKPIEGYFGASDRKLEAYGLKECTKG